MTHPHLSPRRRAGRLVLFGLLCAAALTASPAFTGTLEARQVRETVFPNGLRLVVKEARASDLAAVQVWIRAGGFLEDEKTAGMAHVLEHLLFKESDASAATSVDAEIENLGGLLEATTEKDWTRLTCTVNGRYVGRVLQLVADTLRKPRFKQADLDAEKPLLVEEVGQIRVNPEAIVSSLLYDVAFQKHPYRYDVRGTPRFLQGVTLDAVRSYYQKYYVPGNMTVVVVGDVDAAGVERATRTAFHAEQPAPPVQLPLTPDERACEKPERRTLPSPFSSGFVGLAFPAPSVKELPDTHVMDVLLTMLEHGGTGRLPRLLRGMGVQATYETRRQAGLFLVLAATGSTDVEQVEALLRKEIEFVSRQPVPEAELSGAKRALRGSYALDNEPYAGQAGSLGYYAAIDRWQFATDYLARVEAVTAQNIQDVARKYLNNDRSVAVLLKPRAAPAPPRTGT